MKRSTLVPFVACALTCSLLAACGDDDDGNARAPYVSGVTGTVMVSGLDENDLNRICTSLDAYVETEINFDQVAYVSCLPAAIVLGGTQKGCNEQLDSCMALFPKPITVEAQLRDQEVCFSDLRRCQATVSSLEGCLNVNLDLAFQILDSWSCNRAGEQDLQKAAARAMNTASACADIDASCNDFVSWNVD